LAELISGLNEGIENHQGLFDLGINIVTWILGIIVIFIAIWRSKLAYKQVQTSLNQSEISQDAMLDTQFSTWVGMLASDNAFSRKYAIQALEILAANYPEKSHKKVMEFFCAIVSHHYWEFEQQIRLHPNVHDIMKVLGDRSQRGREIEKSSSTHLTLLNAQLRLGNEMPSSMNLSNMLFPSGDFCHAKFRNVRFADCNFMRSDFFQCEFVDCDFTNAKMGTSNIAGARFRQVRGLTQSMIEKTRLEVPADFSVAQSASPPLPVFEDTFDSETGLPIKPPTTS